MFIVIVCAAFLWRHNPLQPVEVDEGRWDQYLVGSSPLWRAGKSLLGSYVPRRFSAVLDVICASTSSLVCLR